MMSRLAMFAMPLFLLAAPAAAQDAQANDPRYQDAQPQRQDVQRQNTQAQEAQPDAAKPETVKPLTEAERIALAAKAREAAELRVERDMVTMTSLVEALSKNLGQIHYLRTLCFGLNDQKWRDYGQRMMEVEAAGDTDRHRQLVRAFNAGYYQEKDRHTECSRDVSADVAALAENGRHISSMLGDPYRER